APTRRSRPSPPSWNAADAPEKRDSPSFRAGSGKEGLSLFFAAVAAGAKRSCGSRLACHCAVRQTQGPMTATEPAQFDEMLAPDGSVRRAYADYQKWLSEQDAVWMRRKGAEAETFFRRTGITFNVYGDEDGEERLIPFDMVPRILTGSEWRRLSRGIEQRVRAINAFMHDLYHRQEIIRSGRLPERLFRDNSAWLPQMVGFTPPGGVYTHIVGIDLVRTGPDEFLVLEDNARTPSGVSYMLENRETMMAMFPELFSRVKVQPVSNYPRMLAKSLAACAPRGAPDVPTVAVLTPGIYNSAYFEH